MRPAAPPMQHVVCSRARSFRAADVDLVGRSIGRGLIEGHPVPAGTGCHRTLDVVVALPRELEVRCTPGDHQLSRVMSLMAPKTHHHNIAHRVTAAVLSMKDVVQIKVPGCAASRHDASEVIAVEHLATDRRGDGQGHPGELVALEVPHRQLDTAANAG